MEVIYKKETYSIITDIDKLDIGMIHKYLSEESYWAQNIPMQLVKQSIENSLNFGLFHETTQIGFARVVTDKTKFAYLCDVFIVESYQKKGLSSWLMEVIMNHCELRGIRLWILATTSADWLYEKYGFTKLNQPERYMEKRNIIDYKNV
ncbi:GNAT family N-acetyltransferase [Kordia sp.]|uniref:GNAT family N-acetyltransferase n=1 Tax=Kordia sp. TaxID=1965332 RepID=UPI0025C6728E|nr:GNAT family N-acetyltransferase [Kordia sp.]MCH2193382.1 GNAT family N-acetyltransferase [Kordia sp.]